MDNPEPHPKIALTIERVCCPLHGEPFREEWPRGYMPFALTLLQAVLARPAFVDECEGHADWVDGALDATPLCERVTRDELLAAFTGCGIGKGAVCDNCGVTREGVAMLLSEPGNAVPSHRDHVCFVCIVDQLRPS